jgi:hypothetical protein
VVALWSCERAARQLRAEAGMAGLVISAEMKLSLSSPGSPHPAALRDQISSFVDDTNLVS